MKPLWWAEKWLTLRTVTLLWLSLLLSDSVRIMQLEGQTALQKTL